MNTGEQTPTDNKAAPQQVPDNGATNVPDPTKQVDFFGQLERLLDKLVPPDSVTVTTASGGEVQLPGAIPARAQVRVFRHMRELLEMDSVAAAAGAMQGGSSASVVDVIVALATDETVAEKLAEIFTAAYPDALGGADPLDELPLEDLVLALAPFSQRFAKRLGTGITRLAKGASDLQA